MERKCQVKKQSAKPQSVLIFYHSNCTDGGDETSQRCDPAVEEISGTILTDSTRYWIRL